MEHKLFILEHQIDGQVTERLGSFDLDKLIDRAKNIEHEIEGENSWHHPDCNNPEIKYYSMGNNDDVFEPFAEIIIFEINMI